MLLVASARRSRNRSSKSPAMFCFDQLLGAAVKQADMGIDAPIFRRASTRRNTPCAAGCYGEIDGELRSSVSAITHSR